MPRKGHRHKFDKWNDIFLDNIWSKFMGKNGLIAIGACESFLLSTNEWRSANFSENLQIFWDAVQTFLPAPDKPFEGCGKKSDMFGQSFFAIRGQKFRAPGASAWASPPALSQNRLHRCGGFLHKLRVKVVSLLEQIIMSVHGTKAHPSCIFIRCVGWFAEYVLWWSLKTNWIYLNLRMIIVTCYLLSAQQKCPDTKSTQVYNKMLTHASEKQPALYFWELSICSARCSILSWLAVNLVNWRKWKKNFVKFYSDAWFPFLQGGGQTLGQTMSPVPSGGGPKPPNYLAPFKG